MKDDIEKGMKQAFRYADMHPHLERHYAVMSELERQGIFVVMPDTVKGVNEYGHRYVRKIVKMWTKWGDRSVYMDGILSKYREEANEVMEEHLTKQVGATVAEYLFGMRRWNE